MTIEVMPPNPDTFDAHWAANHEDIHPAYDAGEAAMCIPFDPEAPSALVDVTDVSLRDGLQQPTKETGITEYNPEITAQIIAERAEIFGAIVDMGTKRIEIGHLGNEVIDQEFGKHLIGHIASMNQTDSRYEDMELQVLFGSQNGNRRWHRCLTAAYQEHYPDSWKEEMSSRWCTSYDRADEAVTEMASSHTLERIRAAHHRSRGIAIRQGFTNFSISGELATVSPFRVTQFFSTSMPPCSTKAPAD